MKLDSEDEFFRTFNVKIIIFINDNFNILNHDMMRCTVCNTTVILVLALQGRYGGALKEIHLTVSLMFIVLFSRT